MSVGFDERIKRFERAVMAEMEDYAEEAEYLFQAYVEENFAEGSSRSNEGNQLRSRTGDLTRSYIPGQPGNISEVEITAHGLKMRIGTSVVYAKIHEKGGFIESKGKMESFFWAMYYATSDEFYRALALTVRVKGGIQIPPRPFHGPATKMMQTEGKQILLKRLARLLKMAWANSETRR